VSLHLVPDLVANVAKCDRCLKRLASMESEGVDGLCERLSRHTGKRVACPTD
jgi:hypothetical protein